MIYKPFSIVVVPFPFVDKHQVRRRPALVLSSLEHQKTTRHITLLMITSAKNSDWANDYLIDTLKNTGLTTPSIIRQKLFTIDTRLVIKSIGALAVEDQKETSMRLTDHLPLLQK